MGIGNLILNWGVLALGLVLSYFGCLFIVQYVRQYKRHVTSYGRVSVGQKYGTSWTRADTSGVVFMSSVYVIAAVGIPGALLFFFTSLPDIGIPLWIGCTLSIAGILLFIFAMISLTGLAKGEVDTALNKLREQKKDDVDDNQEPT